VTGRGPKRLLGRGGERVDGLQRSRQGLLNHKIPARLMQDVKKSAEERGRREEAEGPQKQATIPDGVERRARNQEKYAIYETSKDLTTSEESKTESKFDWEPEDSLT